MWLWCVYGSDRPVGVAVSVCTCTCNTSDDTTNQDMISDDPDEAAGQRTTTRDVHYLPPTERSHT